METKEAREAGEKGEKTGFWGGLLRSRSLLKRPPKVTHRLSDAGGDGLLLSRRRRSVSGGDDVGRRSPPSPRSTRRRISEPMPAPERRKTTTRAAAGDEDGAPSSRAPLTQWPPAGMSSREELPQQDALELIARGAPAHKGRKRSIPHTSDKHYALYATTSGNHGGETDAANLHDAMAQLMTLRMQGQGLATYPWETLEQPSYAFFYGQRPGTITLNQWAAMASVIPPTIALRDSGVAPRTVRLEHIFARLKDLQAGLEDDDLSLLYRNLYKRFLKDPDKILGPHKTLDKQITDLIMVLSRPDWIDFTDPKNQVATRFIFDASDANRGQYQKFFHQLLLSLELDLRIHSRHHGDWAKEKLLHQMPPTIKWNLALARRWRENVRVESYGATPEQSKLPVFYRHHQITTYAF